MEVPRHRRSWLYLLLGVAVLSPAGRVLAQALPSTSDLSASGPAPPKWEAGLVGVLATAPTYPASEDNTIVAVPVPYFDYHGKSLQSDDDGSRLRQLLTPNLEIGLSGGGALSSDSNDSRARRGMPDLDYLLEAGPNLRLSYDGDSPYAKFAVDLPLRFVVSAGFDSGIHGRGAVFAPELSYSFRKKLPGTRRPNLIRISFGSDFASTALGDYFYTVRPQYVTPDRPAYDAKAGYLGSSLGVRTIFPLGADLRGFVALRYYSHTGAANDDSPLFRSEDGASAAIGFTWTIFQSQERAEQ